MDKHVDEFIRRVRKQLDEPDFDIAVVHQTIEVAYEQCIVTHGIKKSDFLRHLGETDMEIFTDTVDHLFTPINWSQVKLRTMWGIRNTPTGNLLTLERAGAEDSFLLKESSDNPDELSFAPMMSGSKEDSEIFVKMLQRLPSEVPIGEGESTAILEVDERINTSNLEVSLVKVIF